MESSLCSMETILGMSHTEVFFTIWWLTILIKIFFVLNGLPVIRVCTPMKMTYAMNK
jgi:hypothetical protein